MNAVIQTYAASQNKHERILSLMFRSQERLGRIEVSLQVYETHSGRCVVKDAGVQDMR